MRYLTPTPWYKNEDPEQLLCNDNVYCTVWQAFVKSVRRYKKHTALADVSKQSLTYHQVKIYAMVLAQVLQKKSITPYTVVGLMLPNVVGSGVVFWALQSLSAIPAMLNYTAGATKVLLACQTANTKVVITSLQFVKQAKLEPIVEKLLSKNIKVLYTENLKKKKNMFQVVGAFIDNFCERIFGEEKVNNLPTDTAVILFTSGSEGDPKGVALSHQNLLANCYQIAGRLPFGSEDCAFNAMPMFHSFGLTAGFLLPQIFGAKSYLYPSPLHYKQIPPLLLENNATIFFSTDTFLRSYIKYAKPVHFSTLWGIFAGAEPLHKSTYEYYTKNLNVPIYHGYGVTECSPVISVNSPEHNNPHSVGKMLVGMSIHIDLLEQSQKIDEKYFQGSIYVAGKNVMQGYMFATDAGAIHPLKNGWYDTGDAGYLDEHGYLHITGRIKRFAKIAGEMVSLSAVENLLYAVSLHARHATIAIPDSKKGQVIVAFTDDANLARDAVVEYAAAHSISMLMLPVHIETMATLPLLASGKIDYQALKEYYFQRA